MWAALVARCRWRGVLPWLQHQRQHEDQQTAQLGQQTARTQKKLVSATAEAAAEAAELCQQLWKEFAGSISWRIDLQST